MHRIESTNMSYESDGTTRFANGPPGTTVNAEWLNAIQEELMYAIEQSGQTVLSKTGDTKRQLWGAIRTLANDWDEIIRSQNGFNDIIERVGANSYKIKDTVTSVFFDVASGGYACAGASSFLSGGDTWGYIKTNNCTRIQFAQGAYLNFAATQGYLHVDTEGCYLSGVDIRGDGTTGAASAIPYSFYLDAYRVTFWRCKTSSRYSNHGTRFVGFEGNSADTEILATSAAYHCTVYNLDCTMPLIGMKYIYNNYSPYVYDLDSSGAGANGSVIGFYYCRETVNAHAFDLAGATVKGMSYCIRATNPFVETLDSSTSHVFGFDNCDQVSNGRAFDLDANGGTGKAYGWYQCDNLSGCKVDNIESDQNDAIGFRECDYLSGCTVNGVDVTAGTGKAYGYYQCDNLSSCYATDIDSAVDDAYGFYDCENLTSCKIIDIDHSGAVAAKNVYGFSNCNYISSCHITDMANNGTGAIYGFYTCNNLSANKIYTITTSTADIYGYHTCKKIVGCSIEDISMTSSPSKTINGFYLCNDISGCDVYDITGDGDGDYLSAFNECNRLSSCRAEKMYYTDAAGANENRIIGFDNCNILSSCYVYDIDNSADSNNNMAFGFYTCNNLSSCVVDKLYYSGAGGGAAQYAFAYRSCAYLSSCIATDIVATDGGAYDKGFASCEYGSSLYTDNTSNDNNDFIDTADAGAVIATDFSCNDNWT